MLKPTPLKHTDLGAAIYFACIIATGGLYHAGVIATENKGCLFGLAHAGGVARTQPLSFKQYPVQIVGLRLCNFMSVKVNQPMILGFKETGGL